MTTHNVAIPPKKKKKKGTIMAFSDLYMFSHTVWRFLPVSHCSPVPKYHIESKLKKTC